MQNIILVSAITLSLGACGNPQPKNIAVDSVRELTPVVQQHLSDTLQMIADTANLDWTLLEPISIDKITGNWLNLSDFSEGGSDPNSPGVSLYLKKGGVATIVGNHTERDAKWSLKGSMLSIEDGGKTTRFIVAYMAPEKSVSGGTFMYLLREDRGYFGVLSTDVEP
jgi:hypothetical protein